MLKLSLSGESGFYFGGSLKNAPVFFITAVRRKQRFLLKVDQTFPPLAAFLGGKFLSALTRARDPRCFISVESMDRNKWTEHTRKKADVWAEISSVFINEQRVRYLFAINVI